ncbi:hypothetical protein ACF3NG_04560 [Aerococcaceae bacterium WGS1372]
MGTPHRLFSELNDGILLVNPGALNNPRGLHAGTTYAIVNVDGDALEVNYYDDEMNLLDELTQTYFVE